MDAVQEKRLIKKILRGDGKSANELIKHYYKEIYAYAYRQTSSKETSMDITQEIFISVLNTLHTFDSSKSAFRTWLYAVASNKIYDYYRSKKIVFEPFDISELNIADESDFTLVIEMKETARKAMQSLLDRDKELERIVCLKVFSSLTFREIGQVMCMNENTVKTKYYSALSFLRKELEK